MQNIYTIYEFIRTEDKFPIAIQVKPFKFKMNTIDALFNLLPLIFFIMIVVLVLIFQILSPIWIYRYSVENSSSLIRSIGHDSMTKANNACRTCRIRSLRINNNNEQQSNDISNQFIYVIIELNVLTERSKHFDINSTERCARAPFALTLTYAYINTTKSTKNITRRE